MAEDGWNSRDPERVALAYTVDSQWRNRAEFPSGRGDIIQFLTRKQDTPAGKKRRCSLLSELSLRAQRRA